MMYHFKFKAIALIVLNFMLHVSCSNKQTDTKGNDELQKRIEKILTTKKGEFGVSVISSKTGQSVDINGNVAYPMLSTFKFPIALTVLHQVEAGEIKMDQLLFIKKAELFENTWSPFKEKYPDGDISISLEEALTWMMVQSDNNMTDILLRLIGGTEVVEKFINDKNIVIKNNEVDMHQDWDSQFVNTATPNAYASILEKFCDGKILNKTHTKWLYQQMVNSQTGVKRLQGKLPNVVIAHRAGTSFTSDAGIIGAINNVGIMELPKKEKIFIAVFIHDTPEEFGVAEEIIADIAKITYLYYSKK